MSAITVREETEVADFDEAGRQDMKQESPDELDGSERHQLLFVVIGRVSPAEGHLAAGRAWRPDTSFHSHGKL
jgi:hypothetical protein